MSLLAASRDLAELIRKMDDVFHSKSVVSGKSMFSSLYKYVPSIREQLQVIFDLIFCLHSNFPNNQSGFLRARKQAIM